jgi:hypothetical protein
MKGLLRDAEQEWCFGMLVVFLMSFGHPYPLLGASPEQTLAAMDACRDRVINGLSLGDKMALRAAMDAILGNPDLLAANRAVANAPSAEARIDARNRVAALKLDLLGRQNPSLKPTLDKIRTAQALIPQ